MFLVLVPTSIQGHYESTFGGEEDANLPWVGDIRSDWPDLPGVLTEVSQEMLPTCIYHANSIDLWRADG